MTNQNTLGIGCGKGTENFETRRKGKFGSFYSSDRGAGAVNPDVDAMELDPLFCLQIRSVYCAWEWCYANGDLVVVMTGNWTRTVMFWSVRLKVLVE